MRQAIPRLLAAILTVPLLGGAAAAVGAAEAEPYETRRSEGVIAFELTPRALADGRLVIDISADTHSGDLAALDLAEIVTLDAAGTTYRPVAVQGLTGHHASGSVTFEIVDVPDRFAVTMTGVPDVGDLRFEWP